MRRDIKERRCRLTVGHVLKALSQHLHGQLGLALALQLRHLPEELTAAQSTKDCLPRLEEEEEEERSVGEDGLLEFYNTIRADLTHVNGQRTAFMQRFSNQRPLKAFYNHCLTFTHACTHSHTDGGRQNRKAAARPSGAVRLRRLARGNLDTRSRGSN